MSIHPSLTTTFTLPAACTTAHYLAAIEYSTVIEQTIQQSSSCFAPGWTSAANPYGKGANTWSGLPFCPSGQTVAATSTDVSSRITAVCCSSNWGDVYTNGNSVDGQIFTFWMCQSSFSVSATTVAMPTSMTGQTVITGVGDLESTAEYLFLYNRAELTATSSASSSSSSSASSASSASSTLSTNLTSSGSSVPGSAPSHSLSTGAKAEIGVGIVVVVVLGILGVALFYIRKRRRGRLVWVDRSKESSWQPYHGRHELQGIPRTESRVELDGKGQRQELDGQSNMVELPGE